MGRRQEAPRVKRWLVGGPACVRACGTDHAVAVLTISFSIEASVFATRTDSVLISRYISFFLGVEELKS